MATHNDTTEFILNKLGDRATFTVRSMFGEYALYANAKTVGFICDDTLFVKIVSESEPLASICEQGPCYPGSKPYYIMDESQLSLPELPAILVSIAASISDKKKRS